MSRHIVRGFFGVQRRRRQPLAGVSRTHLEGHTAAFTLSDQQTFSVRIGMLPRANRYKDTSFKMLSPLCVCYFRSELLDADASGRRAQWAEHYLLVTWIWRGYAGRNQLRG